MCVSACAVEKASNGNYERALINSTVNFLSFSHLASYIEHLDCPSLYFQSDQLIFQILNYTSYFIVTRKFYVKMLKRHSLTHSQSYKYSLLLISHITTHPCMHSVHIKGLINKKNKKITTCMIIINNFC